MADKMQWYRVWHGMPTDIKHRLVSKRSGRPLVECVAVFAMLLDLASQASERGSIAGVDPDLIDVALDIEGSAQIVDAMNGILHDGSALSGWDARQTAAASSSAERMRKHRDKQRQKSSVTNGDSHSDDDVTDVTHGDGKRREEENREDKQLAARDVQARSFSAELLDKVEKAAGANSQKMEGWAIAGLSCVESWLSQADASGIGPDRAAELILSTVQTVHGRNPASTKTRPAYFEKAVVAAFREERVDRSGTARKVSTFGSPPPEALAAKAAMEAAQ